MLCGELVFAKEHADVKFVIIDLIFSEGSSLTMTDYHKAATSTLDPEKLMFRMPGINQLHSFGWKTSLAEKRQPLKIYCGLTNSENGQDDWWNNPIVRWQF